MKVGVTSRAEQVIFAHCLQAHSARLAPLADPRRVFLRQQLLNESVGLGLPVLVGALLVAKDLTKVTAFKRHVSN